MTGDFIGDRHDITCVVKLDRRTRRGTTHAASAKEPSNMVAKKTGKRGSNAKNLKGKARTPKRAAGKQPAKKRAARKTGRKAIVTG